ncbi:MAG: electron transfer flavoprotein subunit alpha/FixB family protein, partial [Bacteroidetes bacterium]|jgi:electron transfer flavoprotein alpha subunit|nr:electron transfer flavoprotein subunit alpha/FixB family protein [Bacteroidota bacterium]
MKNSIWIWVHHRDGTIDDITFGLVQEAIKIAADMDVTSPIVAIAVGNDFNDQTNSDQLNLLGDYGVDRVIHFKGSLISRYHGEYYAKVLSEVMEKDEPLFFLMVHDPQTADLAPRLAAILQSKLVTRAVDLCINNQGIPTAVRPIANGHLFEKLTYNHSTLLIATLLLNVLVSPEASSQEKKNIIIDQIDLPENEKKNLRTKIVNVIEATPENLDISEADIILAAGRGVGKRDGKGGGLDAIHELAGFLGATVAGSRPVIDWDDLPFERQIGQTGKTVTPRLIINCGISGANEYTAGIEKSKQVIAINNDARARIFRFADLGIVGDLHQILPLLIKRLIELKETD